ncbi:MAG: hypothetical protein WCW67_01195 [Candidatus Margulisiibacteriota bacterium]|jgi:hypothetical protein
MQSDQFERRPCVDREVLKADGVLALFSITKINYNDQLLEFIGKSDYYSARQLVPLGRLRRPRLPAR